MSPLRSSRAGMLACVCVGALALCACTGSAASAAWTRPETIATLHEPVRGSPTQRRWEPELRVAAGGGSTVYAWTNLDRAGRMSLQARTRATPHGPLGPILDVASRRGVYDIRVAVGPGGHAIVAWSRSAALMQSPVQARSIVRGRMGRTIDLGSGTLTGQALADLKFAVDRDGNAGFGWVLGDKRAQLQSLSATGVLGAVVTVPTPDLRIGVPSVAVASSGAAVVAWDNATRGARRLYARTASTSGRIDPVVSLWVQRDGHPRDRAIAPQLGISDAGDAFATWSRRGNHISVQGRFLSASGMLGPTISLAPRKGQGEGRELVVTPGGRAVVASGHSLRPRWRARLMSRDGTFGPASAVVTEQRLSSVSLAESGRAVFGWATARGVFARALTARDGLGPRRMISARGERAWALAGYVDDVYLVTGAAGEHAVVAWLSGSGRRLRAATGP